MIKKKLFNVNSFITLAILTFVIFTQGPVWLSNFKHESTKLTIKEHLDYINGPVSFPSNKRSMVIFWSSTCAPCKLEMWRLKRAVDSGDIKKEQVYAINTYENTREIRKFITKNPYPFQFISNEDITRSLSIVATPTIALLENNKITRLSTGLSFIGLWYAQFYLNETI